MMFSRKTPGKRAGGVGLTYPREYLAREEIPPVDNRF